MEQPFGHSDKEKTMNQQAVIIVMRRSGWELEDITDGFAHLCKRDRSRNLIYPDYIDFTVFPNGRVTEGQFHKYPNGRMETEAKKQESDNQLVTTASNPKTESQN